MPATIDIPEAAVLGALRTLILQCVPDGTEVVRGVGNRVAPPPAPFVMITPLDQKRLTLLPTTDYTLPVDQNPGTLGSRLFTQQLDHGVQVDCFGPLAADWAATIATLVVSPFGSEQLAPTCAPLYCGEPMQSPFVGGELQQDERWTFTVNLQYNPTVTVAQDFMTAVNIGLINVDVTFPPEPVAP